MGERISTPPSRARPEVVRRAQLVAGPLALVAYVLLPSPTLQRAAITTLAGAAGIACLAGVRRYRPARRLPWTLLGAGLLVKALGDIVWYTISFNNPGVGSIPLGANVFYAVGYGLMTAALISFVRPTRLPDRRAYTLDTSIIVTNIAVLWWVFVIEPYIDRGGASAPSTLTTLSFPFMDVLLVAACVSFIAFGGKRTPSHRLLAAGIILQLVADWSHYVVSLNDGYEIGGLKDALWILAYLAIGSAALHPSMSAATASAGSQTSRLTRRRLIWFGVAASIGPVILLLQEARGSRPSVPLIAGATLALFGLVLLRMAGLNREIETQVQKLRTQAGELRQTRSEYATVVDNIPAVVYTSEVGRHGTWTYVSPQIEAFLGYPAEEWRADPDLWAKSIHPHDLEQALAEEALYRTPGREVRSEYRMKTRDGQTIWVQDQATLLKDANGELFWQGVLLDITEERSLQEQLLQAQKLEAVGRLAGGVAHDFNNLLAVIINYATFLSEELADSDPRKQDAQAIRDAGERAGALTSQLLTFSRKDVSRPQVIDLVTTITDVRKILQRVIGEDIQLETIFDSLEARVRMDPGQTQQIIMNLAINARDAMPNGGVLTISVAANAHLPKIGEGAATRSGAFVRLSVVDSGQGIPADLIPHLFEPYFTTKPRGKGTGLGLAAVHGIVEQAGGAITVHSKGSAGTSFDIFLPQVEEGADEMETGSTLVSALASGKILVVEDEPELARVTQRILESAGYEALVATSGAEALEIYAHELEKIDLVLTDVVMPVMSGKELADRIKKVTEDQRVLFMSGYNEEVLSGKGLVPDKELYLRKPFTAETLLATVRRALPVAAI
jgi:PAS domain S-box-containing protein